MKKKSLSLILVTLICAIFITNVQALSVEETTGIGDLCVKKGENDITVAFTVKEDLDVISASHYSKTDLKIVESSITCDSLDVSGTNVTEETKLTKGTRLYVYKELTEDIKTLNIYNEFTKDNIAYIEVINYDMATNKYSIDLVNKNYIDNVYDAVIDYYGQYIYVGSGDYNGFIPSYNPNGSDELVDESVVILDFLDLSDYTVSINDRIKEVQAMLDTKNISIPATLSALNSELTNLYANDKEWEFAGGGCGCSSETECGCGIDFISKVNSTIVKTVDFTNNDGKLDGGKTLKELVAKVKEELATKTVTMTLEENQEKVNTDILKDIKETGYIATINTYNEDREIEYAWNFDGSKIDSTDFNVDLTISVGKSENKETINKELKDDKALNIDFKHSGNLPKGTSVTVNVSNNFKDNSKLTLYYYNPETKKLKRVQDNLIVKDGYVTFSLEHCSEYVLSTDDSIDVPEVETPTENEPTNNAQTSSMNIALYLTAALGSISGIAYIARKTKKEN